MEPSVRNIDRYGLIQKKETICNHSYLDDFFMICNIHPISDDMRLYIECEQTIIMQFRMILVIHDVFGEEWMIQLNDIDQLDHNAGNKCTGLKKH